jgi:hypothetical protein
MIYSRRVLIYSGNRQSGTINNYTIVLPFKLNNVVRIEWNSSSIAGYIMSLQDYNEGITSSGQSYWRFLDALSNQRRRDIDVSARSRTQQSIQNLLISFFNPDGTAATLTTDHVIELEVFCDE